MDFIDQAQDRDIGFRKMRRGSWLAENRFSSQEGLCSIELGSKYSQAPKEGLGLPHLTKVYWGWRYTEDGSKWR